MDKVASLWPPETSPLRSGRSKWRFRDKKMEKSAALRDLTRKCQSQYDSNSNDTGSKNLRSTLW